ncbi:tripartite terminase subunit UL33 homolog [Striga asiatica]|uniref:Tripartite terminase subunit UL33 homolog n=1 Tax=Striga asiatica TaxID=4170 RepID=A0A5A7QT43_STRAF|nr:tripartite terminase subunit UL33 homolog [Striga asiatica]
MRDETWDEKSGSEKKDRHAESKWRRRSGVEANRQRCSPRLYNQGLRVMICFGVKAKMILNRQVYFYQLIFTPMLPAMLALLDSAEEGRLDLLLVGRSHAAAAVLKLTATAATYSPMEEDEGTGRLSFLVSAENVAAHWFPHGGRTASAGWPNRGDRRDRLRDYVGDE